MLPFLAFGQSSGECQCYQLLHSPVNNRFRLLHDFLFLLSPGPPFSLSLSGIRAPKKILARAEEKASTQSTRLVKERERARERGVGDPKREWAERERERERRETDRPEPCTKNNYKTRATEGEKLKASVDEGHFANWPLLWPLSLSLFFFFTVS